MRPLWYFDIKVRASHMSEGASMSLPVIARLLKNLHGYFGQNANKFALAFPRLRTGKFRHPGNLIRVFAEFKEDFSGLIEWIENNQRVAPYLNKNFPQPVDEKNIIGWKEYRRYRIPTRGTRLEACRHYRIKASEEVPYLRISSSIGSVFSMHIIALEGNRTENCNPTSYGLSGNEPFSLPILRSETNYEATD